jgi:hypothetical protein
MKMKFAIESLALTTLLVGTSRKPMRAAGSFK